MVVFEVILNDKVFDLKYLLEIDLKCVNFVGWYGLIFLY